MLEAPPVAVLVSRPSYCAGLQLKDLNAKKITYVQLVRTFLLHSQLFAVGS
jgi:hypothetical protein